MKNHGEIDHNRARDGRIGNTKLKVRNCRDDAMRSSKDIPAEAAAGEETSLRLARLKLSELPLPGQILRPRR